MTLLGLKVERSVGRVGGNLASCNEKAVDHILHSLHDTEVAKVSYEASHIAMDMQ